MAGIRRRNRRIFIATILVFVLPLGYVARSCAVSTSHSYNNLENRFVDRESYEHDLSTEQRATVQEALAAGRARDVAFKKAWREGLDAAITAGFTSRPDLGRCPTTARGPTHVQGEFSTQPSWLSVAKKPADAATAESGIGWTRDRTAKSLEEAAAKAHTDREAERLVRDARLFDSDDAWTWEALMVIDKSASPIGGTTSEGFTSGLIEGRVYLYDHRRKAVTCAGPVRAENSDEVRFKYTRRIGDPLGGAGTIELDRALRDDLDFESYRAAAEALHFRAGPQQMQEL
ncbi:MAG: hypothetical protein ABJE95_11850 [Byssovorax sp.]